MIDTTLELVNKTTSNSLFMFLFCNLIIILILIGNSKPDSEDESNPGSKEPMMPDSVLSSISMLKSESTTLTSKSGLKKLGFEKSGLISNPTLPLNPGLQEPRMISKSVRISSQPAGSDQTLTSKSGLNVMTSGLKPGSEISEKDEKGSLEVEKENLEVECVLRRRVEEFIQKVNTQWKAENTKSDYLSTNQTFVL